MKKSIKFQLKSLFHCISQKLHSDSCRSHHAFVLPPLPNLQPFSDAELKQCTDVLSPLGYTLIKNIEGNEILLYREKDWREQEKAAESILRKLLQDA